MSSDFMTQNIQAPTASGVPVPATTAQRVEVVVKVHFSIDEKGGAKVIDAKTVKNFGPGELKLPNKFRDPIHAAATHLEASDSHGHQYKSEFLSGLDFHQVVVQIEVPDSRDFSIEPGAERTVTIKYDIPQFVSEMQGSLPQAWSISNRFGASTYGYEFSTIRYQVSYSISKALPAPRWRVLFYKLDVLREPREKSFEERKTEYFVEYDFSCHSKAVRTIHIVALFQPRRWLQNTIAFLVGVASSIVASIIWGFFHR